MTRVLIAEDEDRMRRLLTLLLGNNELQIDAAADGREALAKFDEQAPDLLITDLRMPNMGGLELIRAVRERAPDVPIIVITAFGSIESAVEAMTAGATDYITKPFEEARIRLAITKALSTRELMVENRALRTELRHRFAFDAIVAEDPRMLEVLELARHVATMNTTVLITGESGTGKELVTRAIHEASPRARGPFVALNCAAIPDTLLESELFGHERGSFTGATDARHGRFEQAHGGTLFLDEIGEMALALQAKVLRAFETQEFQRVGGSKTIKADIRFIAATNRDLKTRVAEGTFREDLYYRLHVFPIDIPPLRVRPDDIIPLAESFLGRFAREMGRKVPRITPEAEAALRAYPWPGNVRELQNVLERAMILMRGDALEPALLRLSDSAATPPVPPAPATPPPAATESTATAAPAPPRWTPFRLPEVGFDLEHHERALIEQALERTRQNKTAAARMLGLTRATLRYRLEKYGIGKDGDDADE